MPLRSILIASPKTVGRSVAPLVLAIACALAALALLMPAPPAGAHAELERSDPADGALLAAPPSTVDLWFTEPVNAADGSLAVTIRTTTNAQLAASGLTVDPADARHVTATFAGLVYETYTVVWENRSATDGHTISGAFSFRVGGGPTPGAATTEGENPAPWAILTRWLTFAGLAVAAGGFAMGRLLARPAVGAPAGQPMPTRGRRLALGGAALALVATVAEVPFQLAFPAFDGGSVSLANTLRGLPDAWWFRPAGALVATLLAAAWLRVRRPAVEWAGLAAALVALLGLSLTGHSAAQTGAWYVPAITSNILHQAASALWAGGLAVLAVVRWPGRGGADAAPPSASPAIDPVRRFSPWALGLFAVAAVTGVANAGIILPTVASLWESRYGVTILVKSGLVAGALGLAWWHRRALARSVAWSAARLRPTLRAETIVVAGVVLAASLLALTSPPSGTALERDPLAGDVRLLEQAVTSDGTVAALTILEVDPLLPGEVTTFTVQSVALDGTITPIPADARVFLDFASVLDGSINPPRLELAPVGDGSWAGQGDALSIASWWDVRATVRLPGQPDHTARYSLLLPDPNLYGEDAVPVPDSDLEAQALYQRAFDGAAGSTSIVDQQSITSGDATGLFSTETVVAGQGGQPNSYQMILDSYIAGQPPTPNRILRVGGDSWTSPDGGATWLSTFSSSEALSPADLMDDYAGATGFQLGRQQEVNGELSQAVIFVVPEGRYRTTWYVWWVGLESGQRHAELMVTWGHYMLKTFQYDTVGPVAPPDPATVVNPNS